MGSKAGAGHAGQEVFAAWSVHTLQPEVKLNCLKALKNRKKTWEEKGNRKKKNSLEIHLFNNSLPGLTSKSAGSQEAKPHLIILIDTKLQMRQNQS